jgi:hypothetical protein
VITRRLRNIEPGDRVADKRALQNATNLLFFKFGRQLFPCGPDFNRIQEKVFNEILKKFLWENFGTFCKFQMVIVAVLRYLERQ